MTYTDPGVKASKRASWRETNPRAVLRKLFEDNPSASQSEVWQLFLGECRSDDDLGEAAWRYCFDAGFAAFRQRPPGSAPSPSPSPSPKAKNAVHEEQELQTRIEREVEIALLQLPMPNGKTLGECTGPDCVRFGLWYQQLAPKIPAHKTVADVFTEKQLRALWTKSK